MSLKPDFEKMSKAELKSYVLEHRDDLEAIHQRIEQEKRKQ